MLPLAFTMTELNQNEKYHVLPNELTAEKQKISRIQAGDIMLYRSDSLTLFYDSFDTAYE